MTDAFGAHLRGRDESGRTRRTDAPRRFHLSSRQPLAQALREAALTELDEARRAAARRPADFHNARLACKKLRAWLRLLREAPGLGPSAKRANRLLRDAARELAPFRDAQVLRSTLRSLRALPAQAGEREQLEWLLTQAHPAPRRPRVAVAGFLGLLAQARSLIEAMRIPDAPRAVLQAGLQAGLESCRRRMKLARRTQSAAALHDWRKTLKYHWYHRSLLETRWPRLRGNQDRVLKLLSDRLGAHHDLEVLVAALDRAAAPQRLRHLVAAASAAARSRQGQIAAEALRLGDALLTPAMPPRAGRLAA